MTRTFPGLAALLLFLIPLLAIPAAAQPPAPKGVQAPGYYRMALGDMEITALYDGFTRLKPELLTNVKAKDLQAMFQRMFVDPSNGVQTAVNAFLVHTGQNLILVDAGGGKSLGPSMGNITANVRAAGYDPAQIDTVLLTHLHPDHACGLLNQDGTPAFPAATVLVAEQEAAFWLDPAATTKIPEKMQRVLGLAKASVAPYQAKGALKTFKPGDSLLPGLLSVAEFGHTPGHTGFLFTSGGQSILIWGDVVHSHSVQFAKPGAAIEFDTDQKQAVATRAKLLAAMAKERFWVGGAHLPFPGIGRVRAERTGYAWVPVEFAPMPAGR